MYYVFRNEYSINTYCFRNDGEYLCQIDDISGTKRSKRDASCRVLELKRAATECTTTSVSLVCSPIKKHRLKAMVEKATELNVAEFIPLLSDFTNGSVNIESFRECTIQAAEQCERITLPNLAKPIKFRELYVNDENCVVFPSDTNGNLMFILVCCSRMNDCSNSLNIALEEYYGKGSSKYMPLAVAVGPEGGFSDLELDFLSNRHNVRFVSLGENILRSETAAIVALGYLGLYKP